ncbi:flagellar assembly factor FliW [Cryptosporangium aurantiacum]|uniref:Flagellar assembly factor FliW n=2 Tax=Cryptosporangium aurantiacum TaxID=134849 RepID=A0A1M7R744_9ACTN|nr:flagellar assembly factor FliW [Cryptosporangium aurantiacum]
MSTKTKSAKSSSDMATDMSLERSAKSAEAAAAAAGETLPTIEFVSPMPGFPGRTSFMLVRLDQVGLLNSLRSVDDPDLRLFTIAPHQFFPEYAPEIDDETIAALGTTDPSQLLVLLIVTAGDSPRDSTANLMAPIVVDPMTMRAAQCVLTGSNLPVRAPLG